MRTIFNLTSFLRFLNRNRLFTSVNIFGFAVSLMFVVLLGLYIQDELSVNASQPNKERIYRLRNEDNGYFAGPHAADIKNQYPEIQSYLRTYWTSTNISDGVREATLADLSLMDSSFLTMFEIEFLEGNSAGAMRTKNDVLLSEKRALQLFGAEPAMGKVVVINEQEMIVSGVFRDLKHTHFKTPDAIIPFENVVDYLGGQDALTAYGRCNFSVYLMTYPNVELTKEKMAEVAEFLEPNYHQLRMGMVKELIAEPLLDVYYAPKALLMRGMRSNDITFLTILGSTALLILIFAIINYINLSVAQTGFRAKEAALRRLLGGSKAALFLGFIIESLIVATVSLIFGVILAEIAEPWFQQVMWTDISVTNVFTLTNIAIVLGGLVVIGVVAGVVPATVMTQFKPIDVVKGTFKRQTKLVYSKVLIIFQYCITIVLLIATITIMRQLDFMKTSDLGFNKDNVLMMNYSLGENMTKEGLRNALNSVTGVKSVGFTKGAPASGSNNSSFERSGKNHSFSVFEMDSIAFNIMDFTTLHRTGIANRNAVWLNDVAWNDLELEENATEFRMGDDGARKFQIAGTVKGFHTNTMDQAIGSVMVKMNNTDEWYWNVVVQISGTNQFEVADRVEKAYLDYINYTTPIRAEFVDDTIQENYATQERMSWIIGVMSMLAILISALGLLAMSTYFARQKAQEVAVRKVFGATGSEVLAMLMSNFLKLVVIAIVIAIPIGWYFMSAWLNDYVYRIDLSWTIFAIAGLSALLVAAVTVLWQSLRAVHANPIKAIKD